jgi:uroporphyrinogen-III synthase
LMLSDCLVLVTRPEEVADVTLKLFAGWGAEVCHAPVLKVHPVENKLDSDIGELDTLIFVSRHAVRYSSKLIDSCARKQNALDILAVGPATSALLKAEYDLTATIPAQGVGGVALLANFDPSYWQHRKVGVVRSVDAPTDLLDELTSLNAKVLVLNVYQRQLNHVAYSAVEQFVAAPHRIKIVTGFSSDSLSALRKVAADKFSQLAPMPLIVVSLAIAEQASDLSWSGPVEVAKSTDEVDLRLAINRLAC